MIVQISVQQLPNQQFTVILNGQYCTISLYQKDQRMYMDLANGDVAVCTGAICLNGVDVVQDRIGVFSGTIHFVDNEGQQAPQFDGLMSRYFMLYVSEDEELPELLSY